jgi:Uncharacterized protein conserved in bacteria (DUF2188)
MEMLMSRAVYEVIEHDGGWAYKFDSVFSEAFPTREAAHKAAERAVREQRIPGEDAEIEFEDTDGKWHSEHSAGGDRPSTRVKN